MRFRLGLVTGFAGGYYLGARAGRQRYDQINRQLTKLKRSEAFDEAAERARSVVTEGVDKARSLVDTRTGEDDATADTGANGHGAGDTSGLVVPGETGPEPTAEIIVVETVEPQAGTVADPGGYSSSR